MRRSSDQLITSLPLKPSKPTATLPCYNEPVQCSAAFLYPCPAVVVQAYTRLCSVVKRAQRYPALGCNCRTCNSVVEVRMGLSCLAVQDSSDRLCQQSRNMQNWH